MTGFQWLQVERHEPGIVVIRMNKPPVNALGRELVAELTSVVESLKKDDAVRCVIFGSAGKHFCGGDGNGSGWFRPDLYRRLRCY